MTDATNQANTVADPNAENKEDAANTTILIPEGDAAKPAVPAKVEDKPADQATEVVYEPTGDVGLDMALAFVGKAGFGSEHPAMVAALDGDFSILKAALAQKGVQGWEQMVALGEASYKRTSDAATAKAAAGKAVVIAAAGGEDAWKAVQAWAGANATAQEKQEINALLNAGGVAAKGAVKYLLEAYERANNVVKDPADAVSKDKGNGGNTPANGPLSAAEYATAVQALNIKLGGRLEGSKEYAALQSRRQQGMK